MGCMSQTIESHRTNPVGVDSAGSASFDGLDVRKMLPNENKKLNHAPVHV
jgi:hypothetical protein